MNERQRGPGFTTIEMVIVLALFGLVLVSVAGLHLVALSAGTAAETSSIAVNLARARIEALLALSPEKLRAQDNTQERRQVPAGTGRVYTVHTAVAAPDPARLDLTVTVTWQLAHAVCAGAGCAGSPVTYTRTLATRVHAPVRP